MHIDGRFNGPPASGHGGVSCGVFAAALESRSAAVRLLAPPPLDTPLRATPGPDHAIEIIGPDGPVASVRPVDLAVEPFVWLDPDLVDAAEKDWQDRIVPDHVFPTCFGCGHARPEGDGLEMYAGRVPGTDLRASWFAPGDELAGGDGVVHDWAVWGAVDCPSGAPIFDELGDSDIAVLGELALVIDAPVEARRRFQVISRPAGSSGRRRFSEVGLVDETGRNLAIGRATWVTVPAP